MGKENFIRTTYSDVADKLRSLGFKEIKSSDKGWVFINKGTSQFAELDSSKMVFTNMMCM